MSSVIVGAGEVGTSLHKVLKPYHDVILVDREARGATGVDVLHVCFPFSEYFVTEVERYKEKYSPQHVVIHSTVPPGTSSKLGATHSAILGIHPNLEGGIRTFTKFLAGPDASNVADYFRRAGLRVYLFDKPETSEVMKILDTTFYGVCVEYTKEVKRLCDTFEIPFEAWTLWTENYNEGYRKLGHPEFNRPNLVPIEKKIGGHCVLPNTQYIETDFTKLIQKRNEEA